MTNEYPRNAHFIDLGRMAYQPAWEIQRDIHSQRRSQTIPDTLLAVEHPHTVTLGRTSHIDNLLLSEDQFAQQGIEIVHNDRGGDVTYHGPGQIVLYPILDLNQHKKDVHWYLRQLETCIINLLHLYQLDGYREPEYTGVWVNGAKICAIGVKVSRWVTMHGLALNVNTDLSFFSTIVPCGISTKPVTSLEQQTGVTVDYQTVLKQLRKSVEHVFHLKSETVKLETIHAEP